MYTPGDETPAYKAHVYGTIVAAHLAMPDLTHLVFSFVSARLQIQIKHLSSARRWLGRAASERFKIPTL